MWRKVFELKLKWPEKWPYPLSIVDLATRKHRECQLIETAWTVFESYFSKKQRGFTFRRHLIPFRLGPLTFKMKFTAAFNESENFMGFCGGKSHKCVEQVISLKLGLLSTNSILPQIPQRFGKLPQGEKIRSSRQIVFLSLTYCLVETYKYIWLIYKVCILFLHFLVEVSQLTPLEWHCIKDLGTSFPTQMDLCTIFFGGKCRKWEGGWGVVGPVQ